MDAALVTGWEGLCQLLQAAFTRSTFVTFLHIATGWVLCRSKPTVTNLVCTIGTSLLGHLAKHWTVYERFFYRAVWSLQDVSHLLLVKVVAPLVRGYGVESVIDLAIDDTTCGRCGKHVAYAGYFKDASVGNPLKAVVHWAHDTRNGECGMRFQHLQFTIHNSPITIHQSQFTIHSLPFTVHHSQFVAAEQIAGQWKKGWRTVKVLIYGKQATRHVLPVVCLWYRVGKERPIKLLIIRDPSGEQQDDFAFCTDPTVDDGQIVERFAARWPIEEAIHDAKQYGGFEQVQGWCAHTVERQAPMALVVQTLVKAWYLRYGAAAKSAQPKGCTVCGWLEDKDHPSYLDMPATLRRVLWEHRINIKSTLKGGLHGLWKVLQFTLCAAA